MTNGTEAVQPEKKKGLGTLAWVGIGCGVVLLIVILAVVGGGLFVAKKVKDVAGDLDFEGNPGLAAARVAVRLSPELEEVGVDEDAGTMTVRNTKTGEEVTVDFEDIQKGRLSWRSGDQEVTIDASGADDGTIEVSGDQGNWKLTTGQQAAGDLPDWVPAYPGSEPQSSHRVEHDTGYGGAFQLATSDPPGQVIEFYKAQLEAAGYAVTVNTYSGSEGEQGGVVSGANEAEHRQVTVMLGTDEGSTVVNVTYNEES